MSSQITTEKLRTLLNYDPETGIFTWKHGIPGKRFDDIAGCLSDGGYIRIAVGKKRYKAHRLAFIYMGEAVPVMVDHRNCIKTDNRWANIRPADQSQNQCNRGIGSTNKSGFKGVSWHKRDKRWVASIKGQDGWHHLGYFDTPELAHAAYCNAAERLHGAFANPG